MNPHIRSLNDRLLHELGSNRHGEPLYCWMHTRDLTFPVYTEKQIEFKTQPGCLLATPVLSDYKVQRVRHFDIETWVIAAWEDYTPDQWQAATAGDSPYPERGGLYVPTDFPPMPIGHEPTHRITDIVIRRVKAKRSLIRSEKDAYRAIMDKHAGIEADMQSQTNDLMDECAMHNPNVSLCGLTIPN